MTTSNPQTFKVGEILLREGYLTQDALAKVLRLQQEQHYISNSKRTYKPLGQICVELNLISAEELQRVLRKYNKRIPLGELLINQGLIRNQHVDWALQQQESRQVRLGELLVEAKAISQNQLMDALSIQLDLSRIIPSLDLIDESLLEKMPLDFFMSHLCIPMYLNGDHLTVVMDNPLDEALIKELQKTYKALITPALAPKEDIRRALQDFEKLSSLPSLGPLADNSPAPPLLEIEEEDYSHLPALAPLKMESGSVTVGQVPLKRAEASPEKAPEKQPNAQEDQVVNFLIRNAMKDRADSIHIEPQEKHVSIRYRIDGVLYHKTDLPLHLGPSMISRLKELCHLQPAEQRHQRGRVEGTFNEQQLELQIATYPSLWGETVVIQVKEKQSSLQEMLLNIERIGFSPLNLLRYQHVLNQPGGLVILTGPARSGKSATLYASVNYLNQQNRSIITAENPIEIKVPGLVQGQFDAQQSPSFAEMIASMIHLDPDILMVSEIDSPETVEQVTEIALTGAKLITSYPAFDATGTLLRLNRMGLENYLLASSNVTVLSQRLVRKLCPHCRIPHTPRQDTFNRLGLVDVTPESTTFYKSTGCEHCQQHGFIGQTAIHELLQINEAIREAILDHRSAASLRGVARTECKLVSMAEDGLFKAMEGITSIEEVQRVAFVNEYDAQTPWEAEEIRNICKGLAPEFI